MVDKKDVVDVEVDDDEDDDDHDFTAGTIGETYMIATPSALSTDS